MPFINHKSVKQKGVSNHHIATLLLYLAFLKRRNVQPVDVLEDLYTMLSGNSLRVLCFAYTTAKPGISKQKGSG